MNHHTSKFGLHLFWQFFFVATISLSAKEIRVSPEADPENIFMGETWENATHLVRAISLAAQGDEIWISAGTYLPADEASRATINKSFELKGGVSILGGFSGSETTREQRDHRNNITILSGDLGGDDELFESRGLRTRGFNAANVCRVVNAGALAAVLEGVTITLGAPPFNGDNPGAGILCVSGQLILSNCSLIANASNAGKGGGAISFTNGAKASLTKCSFRANHCTGDGGAVYSLGSDLTITQCELSGNVSEDDGGAIYFRSGNMAMNFCTVTGNRCRGGGGGLLTFMADVSISNSVFWENEETSDANSPGSQITAPGSDNPIFIDHSLIQNSFTAPIIPLFSPFFSSGVVDMGGNLEVNPLFKEPITYVGSRGYLPLSLGGDFCPDFGSPLVDKAATDGSEAARDLQGQERGFGKNDDIGALEWAGDFTPPLGEIFQVNRGDQPRRNLQSLRELFEFVPESFTLVSNSDSDLVTVTVAPGDGVLSISWTADAPTGSVDLIFEVTHEGFKVPLALTLEFIPAVYYVNHAQTAPADGFSWSSAFPHLQDALTAIHPDLSQAIWVAEGTYYPDTGADQVDNSQDESFRLKSGVSLYGGFSGLETSLAERDLSVHSTILSGNITQNDGSFNAFRQNSHHVVLIEDNSKISLLDGFEITSGFEDTTSSGSNLRIDNARALIKNVRFGQGYGIPISVVRSPETVFSSCVFEDLTVENVIIEIGVSAFTLESSRVRGIGPNQFDRVGSFLRTSSSDVVFESTLFTGNRLGFSLISNSAGFNNEGQLNPSSATIRGCTVSGNFMRPGTFGTNPEEVIPLIRNIGGGHFTIEDSIFWNNSWRGDALRHDTLIENLDNSTSSFENCLIQSSYPEGLWNEELGIDLGRNSAKNPRFVQPVGPEDSPSSGGNFSLASSSPALNQGRAAGLTTQEDALGNNRLSGSASDLGAIESDGSLQSPAIDTFLFSGPRGSSVTQVSLRNFLGTIPDTFALVANDSQAALSAILDSSSGVVDLTLTDPLWTGAATIKYSASHENDTFVGEIKVTVLPKVIHVRKATLAGRQDGMDWANAFPSLKNALATAVANSGQEIWISDGIYRSDEGTGEVPRSRMSPFQFPGGLAIHGGFSGNEITLEERERDDDGKLVNQSIISSPLETPDPNAEPRTDFNTLAELEFGAGPTTVLNGLVFQGEPKSAVHGSHGMLLNCEASRATISECSFLDTTLGAIMSSYSFDTVTECHFENTLGITGIASQHAVQSSTFDHATILFNQSSATVTDCHFATNPAREIGPAITANQMQDSGFSLHRCSIDGYQKGLSANSTTPTPITISDSLFINNFSPSDGGAVAIGQHGSLAISRCRFEGNQSEKEGGALNVQLGSQQSMIEGCLFAGNRAEESGGAIRIGSFGSTTGRLLNCTITGNSAGEFGGATSPNGGLITFEACLIAGNDSLEGFQIYPFPFRSNRIKIRNSLVEDLGQGESWTQIGTWDLGGNFDLPPLFQSPNPNPAPSVGGDYRLQANSPAIDQAYQRGNLTHDLSGEPRLSGAFLDLGAYEFQFPGIPPASFSNTHPTLAVEEDENQNGISNFAEFAFGSDPTSSNSGSFLTPISNNQISFHIKLDPQIRFSYQYSPDLKNWRPLMETNDFTFGPDQIDRSRIRKTLLLTDDFRNRHSSVFFRHQPLSFNPNE